MTNMQMLKVQVFVLIEMNSVFEKQDLKVRRTLPLMCTVHTVIPRRPRPLCSRCGVVEVGALRQTCCWNTTVSMLLDNGG